MAVKPVFHALSITAIDRETSDCVAISFGLPETLLKDYTFVPGQYLTLRTTIDGQDVRRSYSLCSAPHEGKLTVAIKEVEGGLFSTFANRSLKVGDVLDVMTPMGNFTAPIDASPRNYVGFAAGSGITPILSLMKSVLETSPTSTFTLFYGNQRTESIIFRETIEGLKNRYLQRLRVYYFLSREHPGSDLFFGRIDGSKCSKLFQHLIHTEQTDHFLLCGPEEMILDVKEALIDAKVDPKKVHFELFTSPGVKREKTPRQTPKGFECQVTVVLDGNKMTFPLHDAGTNILDAALAAGADIPFACKGGVCCTCRAKVIQGKVEMELNYGLEIEELQAGYVLTCQAFPTTDTVEVSFDA